MSKLSELMKELCPNGVDYKKLRDVSQMQRGTSLTKKESTAGEIPVISGGKDPAFYCDKANRDGETITVAGSGAGAGYVQYWDIPIFVNDAFSINSSVICMKYLYYFLKSKQEYIYSTQKAGGVPHVHISSVGDMSIPIPPLDIQKEIVRILDDFANLIKKLKAELVKRCNQYEYYRDKLIVPPASDVKRTKLKDIATGFYRGSGITRDELVDDGAPCIRYAEIYTEYNTWFDTAVSHTDADKISKPKHCSHGDILFAATGETVEDIGKSIAYVGNEDCLVGGDIVVMTHNQNPKYLAYALSTRDAIRQKGKGKVKSKVVHTNPSSLGEIEIFLPSIEVQEKIVNELDNFNTLCFDSKIGIPAEINARQKQYEFYRDKLLSF